MRTRDLLAIVSRHFPSTVIAWFWVVGAAFLCAPLYVLSSVADAKSSGFSVSEWTPILILIAVPTGFMAAAGGAPLALLVGLPLFALLDYRQRLTLATSVGVGLVLSILGAIGIFLWHMWGGLSSGADFIYSFEVVGVCGPVAGLVFWRSESNRKRET